MLDEDPPFFHRNFHVRRASKETPETLLPAADQHSNQILDQARALLFVNKNSKTR